MKIVFIESEYEDEIGQFDLFCFPILPKEGRIIRLKGRFWEVSSVIFNFDSMEIVIIVNKDC